MVAIIPLAKLIEDLLAEVVKFLSHFYEDASVVLNF